VLLDRIDRLLDAVLNLDLLLFGKQAQSCRFLDMGSVIFVSAELLNDPAGGSKPAMFLNILTISASVGNRQESCGRSGKAE